MRTKHFLTSFASFVLGFFSILPVSGQSADAVPPSSTKTSTSEALTDARDADKERKLATQRALIARRQREDEAIMDYSTSKDGKLTVADRRKQARDHLLRQFDLNGDGKLDRYELNAMVRKQSANAKMSNEAQTQNSKPASEASAEKKESESNAK